MARRSTALLLFLLATFVIAAPVLGQQKPFTQDQVQGMVRDGLGDETGAQAIRKRGVDFVPTEEFLQSLNAAGANEAFLDAIRAAGHPAPPAAPVRKPLTQLQVFGLLVGQVQVPSHRIVMLVQGRGIDFTPTDEFLQELRMAGGTDELIEALRNAPKTSSVRTAPEAGPSPAPPPAPVTPVGPPDKVGVVDFEKVLGATREGKTALAQKDNAVLEKLGQRVSKSLGEFGQHNNYAYILDARKEALYYAGPSVDLTEKLLNAYAGGGNALSIPSPVSTGRAVAIMNLQEAIASTVDGKNALAELQKKYQPLRQDFQRQDQEIKAIQAQLSSSIASLSDAEKQRLTRDLETKQEQYKRGMEDAQNRFSTEINEVMQRIAGKMTPIIADYARQNSLALVLDEVQNPVYFAVPGMGITTDIVKRYDAGGGGGGRGAEASRFSRQGMAAFININLAIAGTAQGKKLISDLQNKYLPKQHELEQMQKEIQSLQDRLQNQQASLSVEERNRLNRDLETKQKLFKRSSDDAQIDFNSDRDEVVRQIGTKMVTLIGNYAQQNGIALVMDGTQNPVYYMSPEADITETIIKRYDAANPAGN